MSAVAMVTPPLPMEEVGYTYPHNQEGDKGVVSISVAQLLPPCRTLTAGMCADVIFTVVDT